MKKVLQSFIGFTLLVWTAGCSAAGVQASSATATALPPLPSPTAVPVITGCPDPLAVIKTLYDADGAGQFDTSLALFSEDASFAFWAQGINNHHMSEMHLTGQQQIRSVLAHPGLIRTSGEPDAPVFQQGEVTASGNQLTFMLRPDRIRPNGRPYNPYRVQVTFDGCQIKSLTVIELVTWL
jgi:ABC-type transport system substrate-binding protein